MLHESEPLTQKAKAFLFFFINSSSQAFCYKYKKLANRNPNQKLLNVPQPLVMCEDNIYISISDKK